MKKRLWILGTTILSLSVVCLMRFHASSVFYMTEREWQTSITTWWMMHGHPNPLRAWTPLMGPPWQIPMEFPLFQWISAKLANPLIPLEDTARILSLLFFLISALLLRRLALDLDLKEQVANAACCLYISSPLALAYGYSATIESLALMLALISLWAFVRWLREPSLISLSIAILSGGGAALAKSTTWAVFAAAILALSLWAFAAASKYQRSRGDLLIATLLVLGLPLALGFAWVQFSDSIKLLNPLSRELASTNLQKWNFGSLDLRWSVSGWGTFVLRSTFLVLGPLGLLLAPAGIFRWLKSPQLRPSLPVSTAAITALIAGPLVLSNLYFQHDYYALTGAMFAILLFAQVLFFKKERPWLLLALLLSNLMTTSAFIALKEANYIDPLSDGIVRMISTLPQDSSLVIYGSYLDARIPYESHHRALQTRIRDPKDPRISEMLRRMREYDPRVLICRYPEFEAAARAGARSLGLSIEQEISPGVRIWVSAPERVDIKPLRLKETAAGMARGFEAPLRPFSIFLLPSGPNAAPGLALRARGNLYLFDIRRGLRVIHRRWAPASFLAQYDAVSSFSRGSPSTS